MMNTIPLTKHNWRGLQSGWVCVCGAGPGDAGLLTLHALNALSQADVILYDALDGAEILDWTRSKEEVIYAGQRGGKG